MASRLRKYSYVKSVKISQAERAVINAAMSWQEYNDGIGSRWVRGSPISKLLTAARALRKRRNWHADEKKRRQCCMVRGSLEGGVIRCADCPAVRRASTATRIK